MLTPCYVNTVNVATITELEQREKELAQAEQEASTVANEPIPQRRFGVKGVTKEQQRAYLQRKEQAQANLREIQEQKQKVSEARTQVQDYNAQVAAYNAEKEAVKRANRALARQRLGLNPYQGGLKGRALELFRKYNDEVRIKEPTAPEVVEVEGVGGFSVAPEKQEAFAEKYARQGYVVNTPTARYEPTKPQIDTLDLPEGGYSVRKEKQGAFVIERSKDQFRGSAAEQEYNSAYNVYRRKSRKYIASHSPQWSKDLYASSEVKAKAVLKQARDYALAGDAWIDKSLAKAGQPKNKTTKKVLDYALYEAGNLEYSFNENIKSVGKITRKSKARLYLRSLPTPGLGFDFTGWGPQSQRKSLSFSKNDPMTNNTNIISPQGTSTIKPLRSSNLNTFPLRYTFSNEATAKIAEGSAEVGSFLLPFKLGAARTVAYGTNILGRGLKGQKTTMGEKFGALTIYTGAAYTATKRTGQYLTKPVELTRELPKPVKYSYSESITSIEKGEQRLNLATFTILAEKEGRSAYYVPRILKYTNRANPLGVKNPSTATKEELELAFGRYGKWGEIESPRAGVSILEPAIINNGEIVGSMRGSFNPGILTTSRSRRGQGRKTISSIQGYMKESKDLSRLNRADLDINTLASLETIEDIGSIKTAGKAAKALKTYPKDTKLETGEIITTDLIRLSNVKGKTVGIRLGKDGIFGPVKLDRVYTQDALIKRYGNRIRRGQVTSVQESRQAWEFEKEFGLTGYQELDGRMAVVDVTRPKAPRQSKLQEDIMKDMGKIEFKNDADGNLGYFSPSKGNIVIKKGQTKSELIDTIIHEKGHRVLQNIRIGKTPMPDELKGYKLDWNKLEKDKIVKGFYKQFKASGYKEEEFREELFVNLYANAFSNKRAAPRGQFRDKLKVAFNKKYRDTKLIRDQFTPIFKSEPFALKNFYRLQNKSKKEIIDIISNKKILTETRPKNVPLLTGKTRVYEYRVPSEGAPTKMNIPSGRKSGQDLYLKQDVETLNKLKAGSVLKLQNIMKPRSNPYKGPSTSASSALDNPSTVGGFGKSVSQFYGQGTYERTDVDTYSMVNTRTGQRLDIGVKNNMVVRTPTAVMPRMDQVNSNAFRTVSKDLPRYMIKESSSTVFKPLTKFNMKQMTKTQPKLTTKQITKLAPKTITVRIPRTPPRPPRGPPRTPPVKFPSFGNGRGGKSQGYATYFKRFGKFFRLPGVRSRGEALMFGERAAKNTLGATFKIKPTKQLVKGRATSYTPNLKLFRNYRVSKGRRVYTPDTFIQRRGKRLAFFGERREIQKSRRRKR